MRNSAMYGGWRMRLDISQNEWMIRVVSALSMVAALAISLLINYFIIKRRRKKEESYYGERRTRNRKNKNLDK